MLVCRIVGSLLDFLIVWTVGPSLLWTVESLDLCVGSHFSTISYHWDGGGVGLPVFFCNLSRCLNELIFVWTIELVHRMNGRNGQ